VFNLHAMPYTPNTWPRWAVMWALAFAIYGFCKWLTWYWADRAKVPLWRQIAYLVLWPGLDADAFLKSHADLIVPKPTWHEWLNGTIKLLLGLVILFWIASRLPSEHPYLVGWTGMIGLVLILHFGLFHLLSCLWRSVGILANPLMEAPFAAVSVSEFWSKRWNTAFRDLTHRFLFRPAAQRFAPRVALCLGFVFSGLIHDLVISLPAGGGYGGPTLYFAFQGVAIFLERSRPGLRAGLGKGWKGWLFTMVVLLAPVYLLFHPPFVEGIVLPFMQVI
jgi:hypothetical protein